MVFINYNNTVDKISNYKIFLSLYEDKMFELHSIQNDEEYTVGLSNKQFEIVGYNMAYEYCLNLYFLSLETLADETYIEAEIRIKEKYNFRNIQTQMAHIGINLDKIYDAIKINHEPLTHNGNE